MTPDADALPFVTPDLVCAYTCPLCGHRNFVEHVLEPLEDEDDELDEYRAAEGQGDITIVMRPPASHDCAGCQKRITLGSLFCEDDDDDTEGDEWKSR